MAQIVQGTAGAVGYVDLADATNSKLQTAEVESKAGKFVAPTVAGAGAAVLGAKVSPDLSYDPINASGATAYPITSPTWIIAYEKQTNHAIGTALKTFLQFIYSDGETLAPTVPPVEFSSTRLVGVMVNGSMGSEKPTSIGVHGLISVTGPVSGGNAFGLPAVIARNFAPLVG